MTETGLDITARVGPRRSGRTRYAAAMSLYNAGKLSNTALEIYRTCSLLDGQDPSPLLVAAGVAPAEIRRVTGDAAIRGLIEAADGYLATLHGPGVAEVRTGLNHWRHGPIKPATPDNRHLLKHLPDALMQVANRHPELAAAIEDAWPFLNWITYEGYPTHEIGEGFANGHCYASIIGEDGIIPAKDFDLGLFLIAPHVLYRDHNHAAPELYAPLTGPHGWRFGPGRPLIILPADVPVWNDPFPPHLTKVGPNPFLALFGWTADVQAVARVIPATDWPEMEALRLEE